MKKILLFGLVALMVSCDKNHLPVIQSVTGTPETGKPGTVFSLSVLAIDEDSDILDYTWTADGGSFIEPTNQAQTKWRSPLDGSGKTFSFGITVTDSKANANEAYTITLSGNSPPLISDLRSIPSSDVGGAQFVVKVIASDPDNDPLSYAWTCTEGSFSDGRDGSLAKWQSPLTQQDTAYLISVEISDGIYIIDTSLQINVLRSPGGNIIGNTYFPGCTIPVEGVTMTIGNQYTVSDSAGNFEIREIPYGNVLIEATRTDFNTVTKEFWLASGNTVEIDFVLTSERYTGNIQGIVRDKEGSPLSGIKITVLNPDQTESDLTSISNAQGNYTIEPVPQGYRTILAQKNPDNEYRYESMRFDVNVTSQLTSFDIELQKISLLPVVVTGPLTLISYNYAKGGGEVTYDGGASIVTRGVCWSENHNPQITNNKTTDGGGTGSFESSLTGLTSGATCYVRAYATNNLGKTGYGEELSLQTIPNGTFTDARDQKRYKTVDIGGQTWMAENLNFTAPSGSWCYEDKTSYCQTLGRMYEWNTVINVGSAKDICPAGWRVPTDDEWTMLRDYLGDQAGFRLKSSSGWKNNNGDNSTGFNAKPGGNRNSDGSYEGLNDIITYWTISTGPEGRVWTYSLSQAYSQLLRYNYLQSGLTGYVRCIKY